MNFFQVPPKLEQPFLNDKLLKSYMLRILPERFHSLVEQDLNRFGERIIFELEPLAQAAEACLPQHVPYDPWGNRVDHIKVSEAWNRLHAIAAEEGIVATGYERKLDEFSRVYQFAKLYLYHPSSAIYSCPLAMTDGAARVIELFGTDEMKEKAFRFLTSRDPQAFWTSGQWMTEKSGGSDVSGSETTAKIEGDHYRLYGEKWFTSATTSQMAMTLAKIEGDEKLSLFYVELRDAKGNLQNIQINRLKDKMGTKALPTAELTLHGTPAILVGERGRGVKIISNLFNITRLYNACCAVGYMQRGISLALDYSKKRIAFGKSILKHGLHAETLSDMQVRFEASFILTFHSALLLGKEETGKSDAIESGVLRLLIPLAKLFTAKEGVAIASEVIESFGGAGYMEDTGLPQILRNAQVLSIWEGTTNVLSLDALRAIKKDKAGDAFIADIARRMEAIKHPELIKMKGEILTASQDLGKLFLTITDEEELNTSARALAFSLSKTFAASLLIEQAQWGLVHEKNPRSFLVLKRFINKGLLEKIEGDLEHRKETDTILGV